MKMQYDFHDTKVFAELFDNNYRKLFLFAKSLIRDTEEAKDIVSEAFIKLWGRKKTFSNKVHLQVYFFTIIRNSCIDYLRKNNFRTKVEDQLKYSVAINEDYIEKSFQETELVQMLYERINQLPERMQQVFKLTYLDGYNRTEIAQMLGLSENTIRNTNAASMKILRFELGNLN